MAPSSHDHNTHSSHLDHPRDCPGDVVKAEDGRAWCELRNGQQLTKPILHVADEESCATGVESHGVGVVRSDDEMGEGQMSGEM